MSLSRQTKVNGATILLAGCIALIAAGLPACQMEATSASGGNPPPQPVSAIVSFCDDGIPDCTPAMSFSVSSLRDLVITVAWENLTPGNHVQQLEIDIPAGGPFQVTKSAFLIPDSSSGSFTTTRILPVDGTWIRQRQITGQWTMRVSLDGQAITTQAVELNP
jgi:hypothetical protein